MPKQPDPAYEFYFLVAELLDKEEFDPALAERIHKLHEGNRDTISYPASHPEVLRGLHTHCRTSTDKHPKRVVNVGEYCVRDLAGQMNRAPSRRLVRAWIPDGRIHNHIVSAKAHGDGLVRVVLLTSDKRWIPGNSGSNGYPFPKDEEVVTTVARNAWH